MRSSRVLSVDFWVYKQVLIKMTTWYYLITHKPVYISYISSQKKDFEFLRTYSLRTFCVKLREQTCILIRNKMISETIVIIETNM